jgi:glycosyltransferase involved in cell wall biosynthesis
MRPEVQSLRPGDPCPFSDGASMSGNSQTNRKPSICFVAISAYKLLTGREDTPRGGGAEVQQVLIAEWLVRQGYPVRFITLDHGQPDGIIINDIRVHKAYALEAGIRGIRFFYPRWSGLWAAMARANADVYYQRCAGSDTGQVALWCRLHRRRFIFAAASDPDCHGSLYAMNCWREKALYRIGLRLADAVVSQTITQQNLLRQEMGKSARVIPNCAGALDESTSYHKACAIKPSPMHVLWIGRICKLKRLEWLLDVAEQCPQIVFDVLGAAYVDSDYASFLTKRAAGMPNVQMHGWVLHAEIAEYYRRCGILCCTSAYEGFPNTFLEAWSRGVPVVSTVDPDGVVAANDLGWVAHDVEGIVACLREVIRSPDTWARASKATIQYYLANHTPEVCLPRFEQLLLDVAGY